MHIYRLDNSSVWCYVLASTLEIASENPDAQTFLGDEDKFEIRQLSDDEQFFVNSEDGEIRIIHTPREWGFLFRLLRAGQIQWGDSLLLAVSEW